MRNNKLISLILSAVLIFSSTAPNITLAMNEDADITGSEISAESVNEESFLTAENDDVSDASESESFISMEENAAEISEINADDALQEKTSYAYKFQWNEAEDVNSDVTSIILNSDAGYPTTWTLNAKALTNNELLENAIDGYENLFGYVIELNSENETYQFDHEENIELILKDIGLTDGARLFSPDDNGQWAEIEYRVLDNVVSFKLKNSPFIFAREVVAKTDNENADQLTESETVLENETIEEPSENIQEEGSAEEVYELGETNDNNSKAAEENSESNDAKPELIMLDASETDEKSDAKTEKGTEVISETETESTESEKEDAAKSVAASVSDAEKEDITYYEYEDDILSIAVKVADPKNVDKDAVLVCRRIESGTDHYDKAVSKVEKYYAYKKSDMEMYLYDIHFENKAGDKVMEDVDASVAFTFKNKSHVYGDEKVDVLHIHDNGKLNVIGEDVVSKGKLDEIVVQTDSFSDFIVTKLPASANGAPQILAANGTDETSGKPVAPVGRYISKTFNVDDNGNKITNYNHSMNTNQVIHVPGAQSMDITIEYGGESTSWDWACMWVGNYPNYTASNNYGSSLTGKLGGTHGQRSYHVEGDCVTFAFRSDGSGVGDGYGYYAVVTPYVEIDSEVPAYHFEELEDGTYALVFDEGGDIQAFANRSDIAEAIAPYKNNISEIRLHKETTSLSDGAFMGLSSLKSVTMPRNSRLQTIGTSVFANCDNLESIDIPSTVTSISNTAFTGCAALETITFSPDNTMTALPDGIFSGLSSLKNVTLPVGLTAVPKNCFNGCTSLTDITLPASVTSIGESAFNNARLYEVPDLSNITTIGDTAFSNNPNLTAVSIPENVTSIGTAFRNCTNIEDVIFEDGTSFPTLSADFFEGMTHLKNVKLPDDLTKISNEMFKGCSSLEHIDIPDTVTAIGNSAFLNCTKLQDFEIPTSIKTIGTSAFQNCDSLKDMSIPNTVTSIGSNLFYDCNNLLRVQFEEGSPVSTLPSSMFYGCSKLEIVKLPDGVISIPSSYFRGCHALKHVDMPENLKTISDYAFYDCRKLEDFELPHTLKTIGNSAFYNCDRLTDVVIPNSVTSFGSSVFQDCSALESLVFEEGSPLISMGTAAAYNCANLETLVLPTGLKSVSDNTAYGCSKLKNVDIPVNATTIGASAFYGCSSLNDVVLPVVCTQIYSSAFSGTGITHIELPDVLTSIGSNAFYNTKLQSVIIPQNTTSISSSAFQSISTLESVVFKDEGKDVKVQSAAFASCPKLSEFVTNGRLTYIGRGMLQYDRRLEEFVIDPKVTEVGGRAFNYDIGMKRLEIKASPTNTALKIDPETSSSYYNYTFAKLSNLEELIIDRDITSSYNRDSEFADINPDVHITIGKHVNNLDNLIVSLFTSDTEITFEGENDFSTTTRIPNSSSDTKWSELKGDFYVDPNGVVYKLNKNNNTASLFYIPSGITEYNVPATVTSVAGQTYNVTKIDSYVGRSAADLTTLTVESPENVTIPEFAFTGCHTLQTINGKTELYPDEWASVSLMCDFPIRTDDTSEQVLTIRDSVQVGDGEDATFSFAVSVSNQEKMDEDNPLTYVFPTGRSERVDFAISNESNVDMSDRVIRIYLAFTGDNYTLGNYPVGEYTLVNTSTGARYPFKVKSTDATGVYYYDITGFRPGDTLAFNNQFAYSSPQSAGGDMLIWVESISAEEAAEKEGKTSQPNSYIKAHWYTTPTPYNLQKTTSGTPSFTVNSSDEDDENVYVRNLSYQVKLTSSGESGTSYAKDYIKYIDTYDDLQLNEHMIWNSDVINAVRDKKYYYNSDNRILYVEIDDNWQALCTFTWPSSDLVRSVFPTVITDDNENPAIRINWSYKNTYWTDTKTTPSANLPAVTVGLTIGDKVVQIKEGTDLWKMVKEGDEYSEAESQAMRTITNIAHNTAHYSHSDDQETEAAAPPKIITASTGFSMSKTMTGYNYMGREHGYNITVTNSGLVNRDDIDKVTDTLQTYYYIKPDEMEKMFANTKWGPFLQIDMKDLVLCHLPSKDAVDIYGDEFTITDAQYSGIDPIPYSGCAQYGTDISEKETGVQFLIYWDGTYTHKVLEVKDVDGALQHTYTIGEGCDYATLEEAFKSLGFIVTSTAVYTVTWDLDERYTLYKAHLDGVDVSDVSELTEEQRRIYEYKLRSGRTETFTINSNVKRTDMLLTSDKERRYSNGSSFYSNNTAYARDNTGRLVGSAQWTGYLYDELQLTKSASANGVAWSQNTPIPDDTVIDYKLSFTNQGDTYDVLPLSDKMGGAQVLLVPVRTNKNALYYTAGTEEGVALQDVELDIYNSGGIDYYILDKDGIYRNVIIDGRTTDSIQVSTAPGAAQTLIIWYYQNVEGASTSSSNTSENVSYKALADSTRLGQKEIGEDGSTVTSSTLLNESWLGGHQTHRLYAAIAGRSEQIHFSKHIVEDPESARENLINHSLVENGDEVLYKIIIENTGNQSALITGNRLRDTLPSTKGAFAWSKENVLDIYYVTENLGSTVETIGEDYWYIDAINPANGRDMSASGQYYIHWTPEFQMQLEAKGKVWLYVRLKFPSSADQSDAWDDYIAVNNGGVLYNTFYVDDRSSTVTHELVDVVEGIMQKGVLDTGLSSSGKFKSEDTRHYYQNGGNQDNGSVQEVAYYNVIYNSGNVRLYLEKMEDQLPKGFKFRALINGIPRTANNSENITTSASNYSYATLGYYGNFNTLYYTEYFGSTNSTYMPVATVNDEKRENIVYKNAYISAATTDDNEGHQQITFSLGSQSYGNLKYDSQLGKYYLDPGEAVRFGYMCTVEGYARTENIANNEIAMPLYDKYGLGISLSNEEEVKVTPATYRDIALNDGTCELKTTEEETVGRNHAKQSWVRGTTDWFSSNVSVQRLEPVPGIQKTVGGETYTNVTQAIDPDSIYGSRYTDGAKTGTAYIGTVARTSFVNWLIRVYNEGGIGSNSMEDYTIIDTVDAPYMFTGNFFYDYYGLDDTKISSSSVPIFSLGGRTANDTDVKISTGQGSNTLTLNSTIRVNGDPVAVDGGRATVQLLRDNDGVETIIIRMQDNYHRVPPNSYMALVGHTQYVSSDAVLSKQFFNHAQLEPSGEFDPALVSQGKVLYKDDDGIEVPYAIESGASVTMTAGYTSAARKQVTQLDNTSNTARSDQKKNSIQLPSKYSQFYYDLYIDLPKDDPTEKLVLIDTLPEVGDHSPFVERDTRDSEFKVHMIGENPGFRVWSSANLGAGTKTELTHDKYKFEVTTRREFQAIDWEGEGDGWTLIDLSDGVNETETEALDNARAFRVVIEDEDLINHVNSAIMGKNYQVQVRFNAEAESPEDVDPGTIAWNSFGYRYTVPIGATGMSTSLNAEPLKVGVSVPSVPYIIKDQKTPNNHYKSINTDSEYRFLIYSGAAISSLNDLTDKTMEQIAQILQDNSREFTISNIPMPAGASTNRTDFLDESKKWTFSEGQMRPTEDEWIWTAAAKYTILELPWSENGFEFSDIQHSPVNNYTFTQNADNNVVLRVTNVYKEKGNLKLQKTVQGPSFDENRKFTFTIQLKDGRFPAFGTYHYTGTNIRDGELAFNDDGIATIQLKHGQAIELTDIPSEYTYTVTESVDELYEMTSTNTTGSIVADDVVTAAFVNTRKDTELNITKTVTGNFGSRAKMFDFEVYIIDGGRELSGEYNLLITKADGTTEESTANFVDGAVVFQLQHGDKATISGLPVGARYEVDELYASRKGYETTSTNEAGTLPETGITSAWTNKRSAAVPTTAMSRNELTGIFILIIVAGAVYWSISKKRKVEGK